MIGAVLRKELAVLWASPLPYVVGALYNAVVGLLYLDQLRGREQALLQPLFPLAGLLLLLAVPVLTMRTLAEEKRTGSLDLLLAVPVAPGPLVVGKWLASWLVSLVVLVPTGVFAALVFRFGDPDPGPFTSGFLGLALVAAAAAGIGVLASSTTSSQPVAAMVALFVMLLLWFSQAAPGTVTVGAFLAHFSLSERLRSFAGGAVDTADVVFLVAVVVGTLAAATVVVRRPRRAGRALAVVAVVAVAVVGDVVAHRERRVFDLTVERHLSLTDRTEEIVRRVREQTVVSVYLPADDPERAAAGALLLRYQRLNRHISFRIRDPQDAPGEVTQLGLDPAYGGIAVRRGDQVEHAETVTEQDITGALVRLVRGREATACAATGHGEPSVDDDGPQGLSGARALLVDNGYDVRIVDLLAQPDVPADCDVLLLATPTAPLGAAADAVARHLADDGRVLFLHDPVTTVDIGPLVSPYGITLHRGIVLEGDEGSALPDDPTSPIVRRFTTAHPIARRVPPVYFPAAQAVEVGESRPAEGLVTTRLALTSNRSYLETKPLEASFDAAEDRAGPVTVAAAADRMRQEGGGARRTRVVVVGDVDFATNVLVGEAGNAALFVRAVDWLATDEDEVVVDTNLPAYRPLALTASRLAYFRTLAAGIVPGLYVLAGLLVWALRRGR